MQYVPISGLSCKLISFQLLGNSGDELDQPDFDAIEYINRKFVDEESLEELDDFIARHEQEISDLDTDIRKIIRDQGTMGATASRDLQEAKNSILDLFRKVEEIKSKADQAEEMVEEICKDIKQLDVAKKNLTFTIKTLKNLQMLVTGVLRLEDFVQDDTPDYSSAGYVLSLTIGTYNQLSGTHFKLSISSSHTFRSTCTFQRCES